MTYTRWLIQRGCLENYSELASVWDELDFVWYIPEDEDKAIQALRMRDEYCYETEMPSPRQAPASFLEVLQFAGVTSGGDDGEASIEGFVSNAFAESTGSSGDEPDRRCHCD